MIDALFGIDIVLTFFSVYTDEDFVMIEERKEIACTYLKGWFIIDLVAILPLNLLIDAAPTEKML